MMNKTKKIVCMNPECKKIEEVNLYSNIKYCRKCKEKFKKTIILPCVYCKKDTVSSYNIKEIVCNECKKEGKKLPNHLRTKKIICFYCKQEDTVPINSSNKFSVCKECKSKGYINPQASINGKKSIETIKNKSEEEKQKTNKKLSSSLKKLFKDPIEKKKIITKRKNTYLKKTNGKYKHQMEDPNIVKIVTSKRSLKQQEINEQTKKTNLEKRGYEYSLQDPEVRKKGKETSIIKYGEDHWTKTKEAKQKLRELGLSLHYENRELILDKLKIELYDKEYIHSHYDHLWKCKKCNNIFKTVWNNIQQGYLCPTCYPRNSGTSIAETELFNFINELLPHTLILKNSKKIIPPYELDLYIPSKKIAIEYDGLYWHKDYDQTYHLNKTEKCIIKNIMLIHIFEDEWIFKEDIVKSRLKHILNLSNSKKIYARNCNIKEIDSKAKDEFLNLYHIQGSDFSKIRLGAFYKNELISLMTFSKGNISKGEKSLDGVWELNRFCSSSNYCVLGIASKLLKYFKRNYGWTKIFSYADRRWSNGNLYYKLGFVLDHITKPNYWYTKDYKRIHRFNLRKNKNDPKNIPEKILRLNEGYNTIWDCGNYKFSIKNNLDKK